MNKKTLSVRDTVVFGMLGALMYSSKLIMEALPNIHLVGVLTVAITLVYRARALFPIYVYVLLCGVFGGFTTWWLPYLYVWTVLWGFAMLVPKKTPKNVARVLLPVICGFHGLIFGALCAPVQAIAFGLGPEETLAWIAAGLPFDITHAVSNLIFGLLILPLRDLLFWLDKGGRHKRT
jgi:energy-coupling factor transport system substrate-specific component